MSIVGTPGAIKAPPINAGVLGQGVSYPPTYNVQGRLKLSSGSVAVEEALQAILETAPGERAMLPGYGARIGEFEPIDLARLVAKFKKDVSDYEPRVEEITDSDYNIGPGVGEVTLTFHYRLVGEANERILTYGIFSPPTP